MTRRRARRVRYRNLLLGFEQLENRCLLAAYVSLETAGNVNTSTSLIDADEIARSQREMQIAVSPANVQQIAGLVHHHDFQSVPQDTTNLALFTSENGGSNWEAHLIGRPLGDPICGTLNCHDDSQLLSLGRGDPSIVYDPNGALYIAYLTAGITVGRSLDNGATFEFTNIAVPGVGYDKLIITAGLDPQESTQSIVYVAYKDQSASTVRIAAVGGSVLVNGEPRGFPDGIGGELPFAFDADTNGIPDHDFQISDGGANGGTELHTFPAPAVGPNGVYVVWQHSVNGSAGMLFEKTLIKVDHEPQSLLSFDTNGAVKPFGTDITIADLEVDFDAHASTAGVTIRSVPSIAIDRTPYHNGRVYVAYTGPDDTPAPDEDDVNIFVKYADTDPGTGALGAFQEAGNPHPGAVVGSSQFLPWLDVDEVSGLVAVGWLDTRIDPVNNEQVEMYVAASVDGGASFSETVVSETWFHGAPNGGFREYLGLSTHRGKIYAMWADNHEHIGGDENDQDAYTDRITVTSADFDLDGDVDGDDFLLWQGGFQTPSGAIHSQGDANFDGAVDGNDFLIWQAQFGQGMPGGGSGSGGPTVDLGNAVRVADVIVSGSTSEHDPFSFLTVDGSGAQLGTVPVGGADTISIVFTEHANVEADDLNIVGLYTANEPNLVSFSYDVYASTATWTFDGWALGDQYAMVLDSQAIDDADNRLLDGEWTNPAHISTVNAAVSQFPSGDGTAGGDFAFVMTLLPGDANLDNVVNGLDFMIFQANFGMNIGAQFVNADFDGNGTVDAVDFDIYQTTSGAKYQVLWVLADLNGNGVVDNDDLDIMLSNIGGPNLTWAEGDLNGDGVIGVADIWLWIAQNGLDLDVVN